MPADSPEPQRPPRAMQRVQVAFAVDTPSGEHAASTVRYLVRALLEGRERHADLDEPRSRVTSWSLIQHNPFHAWEPFEDTDIPDLVAEMFPPEPRRNDFGTVAGGIDEDAFEDAHDQWRDECLTLAINASQLPSVLARLERAERVRDAIVDVMARYPIPREPVLEDFPERFFGNRLYDKAAFTDEHDRWQQLVSETVAARERALRTVLAEGGRRTAYLPPQFHREWTPSDLLAVTTLRELLDQPTSVTGQLLAREQRQELAAMLFAADPEVRVPDPDAPDGPAIYEGLASEAHAWIPPGVYAATGLDGQGEFRVVVGRVPIGTSSTASAAFPPAEHDSAVLNRIARILEGGLEEGDPRELLTRIDVLVTATGRPAGGSQTMLEQGATLGELLDQREQQLRPDTDGAQRPDRREGPELDR